MNNIKLKDFLTLITENEILNLVDHKKIESVYKGKRENIPSELLDAIVWFFSSDIDYKNDKRTAEILLNVFIVR